MGEMRVVYVLRSEWDPRRHYVGLTADVRSRLADHNAGGSAHHAKYRPWRLAVSIEFETPAQAADFERYLESGVWKSLR
jgi:predicted GIY-YIG superfamily endonuclease